LRVILYDCLFVVMTYEYFFHRKKKEKKRPPILYITLIQTQL
jgi:hypothetical protein